MNQELLDLAKEIDDNDDAISDALEAEDLETAEKLAKEKEALFKRLYELSENVEDRTVLNEYLHSLYEFTAEQKDLLVAEQDKVKRELSCLKKGSRCKQTYQSIKKY